MCDNISVDTFPPKNDDAAKGDSKKINWKTIHRNFMPNYEKLSTEFSRRLNT